MMFQAHRFIFLILLRLAQSSSVSAGAPKTSQCRFIYDSSFDRCSEGLKSTNFTNQIHTSPSSVADAAVCPSGGICGKIFNISRVEGQTLNDETLAKISEMLTQCCGTCSRFILHELTEELSHMDMSALQSADIIFPFLGRESIEELYGYYYIPIFELPGAYYFTLEMTEKELAEIIITGCLSMWPLLFICVLWAIIAGFFIWLFETWHNCEEFPRSFLSGLFEGFWWSFISMTTVGYGDKAPKRFLGRIFAVVWILVGITITSMYIGALAGSVYSLQAPPGPPVLNGRRVGGLKHQLQDATIVAEHGGVLHDIDNEDEIVGVVELIKMLRRGEIHGFVLNKITYQKYHNAIKREKRYKELAQDVDSVHMMRSELEYKGRKVVTGMLVKEHDDYSFFRRYFENNWMEIQTCNSFALNANDEVFEYVEASHFEGLFYPFFYGTLITLGAIICFGCVYELCRRKPFPFDGITEKIELCRPYRSSSKPDY